MQWRPISDPPEPGKHVLLLLSDRPDDQEVGFHDPECGPDWWWDTGLDRRVSPIRWMPLPELPEDLTANG
jgi:hypothetical protein